MKYSKNRILFWGVLLIMAFGDRLVFSRTALDVRIDTPFGSILVELDPEQAPVTVANFLRYVDEGHFEGGRFHRTVTFDNQPENDVKIEVIQASVNPSKRDQSYPPIALERTTKSGLLHRDGVISMARSGPDTATSSFFICIGDQPSLDYGGARNPDGQGFAAFGKVKEGMDVVRRIQQAPADGQSLSPPIEITRIVRLEE